MQDAETVRQRRSHLESILNVAQRLRLRCFHRLRPCWTNFLSILQAVLLLQKSDPWNFWVDGMAFLDL
jgi:hypothetical protein